MGFPNQRNTLHNRHLPQLSLRRVAAALSILALVSLSVFLYFGGLDQPPLSTTEGIDATHVVVVYIDPAT